MKNIAKVVVLSAVILTAVSFADVWEVPEEFPGGIQQAIDDERVHDGDTISVWCESVPPRIYNEYLLCHKSLFIVNRSFLPNQVPYDSSWDWVVTKG